MLETLEQYTSEMDGISHDEWVTIRTVIDKIFEKRGKEPKRALKPLSLYEIHKGLYCYCKKFVIRSKMPEAETKRLLKQAYMNMR